MLTCYESLNVYDICMYLYKCQTYITAAYYKQSNFQGPGWTINSLSSLDFPEISGSTCRRWFQYSFFWHTPQPLPTKYKKGIPFRFGRRASGIRLGSVVTFLLKRGGSKPYSPICGENLRQNTTQIEGFTSNRWICVIWSIRRIAPLQCTEKIQQLPKAANFRTATAWNNDGWWVTNCSQWPHFTILTLSEAPQMKTTRSTEKCRFRNKAAFLILKVPVFVFAW